MPQQTFNALTGKELKEVILQKISEELDLSGDFGPHLTYPWIKYDFRVRVLSYPRQAVTSDPDVKAEATTISNIPERSETIHEIQVTNEQIIDTPDQARADHNLPIPTATPGPGGVLVDKPVTPKLPLKRGK